MARKRKVTASYLTHNRIKLISGGTEYFQLLQKLVLTARNTIHLQTYIFEEDETGKMIAEALMKAARQNVKVHLLVDGFGSQGLSADFISSLISAGIHFRKFKPLLRGGGYYFGRRLHHKIFVADDYTALVGGMNIGDRYNDRPGEPAWFDRALFIEGEIPAVLASICRRRMKRVRAELPVSIEMPSEQHLVRVRVNDWVRGKNQITRSYLEMFRMAETRIIIMSSYFLPGQLLKRRLRKAVSRGVIVQVVMGRISDVPLVRYAEQYMYRWLFRNEIEVYEYTKSVLHAKVAMYDRKWMTIGSYNVNNISAYAAIELNLDLSDASFVEKAQRSAEEIIADDCFRVLPEEFERKTGLLKRIRQRISYDIFRLLLFISTFYFRQHRNMKS